VGRSRVVIAGVGMLAEKCAVYATAAGVYIAVIIIVAATIIITLLHGLKWPSENIRQSQLLQSYKKEM
jgi:hypothetical protein